MVPVLPRDYVVRTRLWGRLDQARGSAVTVVVAPLGAGKTLGVAGWLRHTGHAGETRWKASSHDLSVDDIRRLTGRYAPPSPPPLVVLDDAHRLSTDVIGYLDHELTHDPEALRVVLVSRSDLGLTRHVTELLGDLTEVRADVMRLDEDETAALVTQHVPAHSPATVLAVLEWSHGWCAAAALAVRALATSTDVPGTARSLTAVTTAGGVTTGTLSSLSSSQRHLLLCIADEPVISVPLARQLTGDAQAGRHLRGLESTGLVVSSRPVVAGAPPGADDGDGELEYHLHPVLRAEARRRLQGGALDATRARAAVRKAVADDGRRDVPDDGMRRLVAVGAVGAVDSAVAVPEGLVTPSLRPRERDVLHELARGATYADIAAHLHLSKNTVKRHVSNLYGKLAVRRRSDALAVARSEGLI
jgi:LuxR family transcriptional regulator, maltose regulon positive regulatory protein